MPSRRNILRAAAAAPALAALPVFGGMADDPVFAAIERREAAQAAIDASYVTGLCENEDVFNALVSAETDAAGDMFSTAPATMAGLVAYLDAVNRYAKFARGTLGVNLNCWQGDLNGEVVGMEEIILDTLAKSARALHVASRIPA